MDAMSGRGELGDQGLVADFYGLGGRAKYRTGRTGADGADWWTGGLADAADYGILDGVDGADYGILERADWGGRGGLRNPGRGGLVDWRLGERSGLWNPGRGGLGRMGRTKESWTGRTGVDEVD